jgi:hypothetical protein
MLEVKLALRHWFCIDDMAGEVLLDCLSGTNFEVMGVQLSQAVSWVDFVHLQYASRLTRLRSPFCPDIMSVE